MTEKLKPCPFCDEEVEIAPTNNGNPFIIYCEHCGLEFGLEKEFYHYQAVEAWNRRAPLPDNRVLTHADRIRSMGDEELAATLMCPNEMGMADIPCDHSDSKNCFGCLLGWLRQLAEEG